MAETQLFDGSGGAKKTADKEQSDDFSNLTLSDVGLPEQDNTFSGESTPNTDDDPSTQRDYRYTGDGNFEVDDYTTSGPAPESDPTLFRNVQDVRREVLERGYSIDKINTKTSEGRIRITTDSGKVFEGVNAARERKGRATDATTAVFGPGGELIAGFDPTTTSLTANQADSFDDASGGTTSNSGQSGGDGNPPEDQDDTDDTDRNGGGGGGPGGSGDSRLSLLLAVGAGAAILAFGGR